MQPNADEVLIASYTKGRPGSDHSLSSRMETCTGDAARAASRLG